jgi:hypothetical protein
MKSNGMSALTWRAPDCALVMRAVANARATIDANMVTPFSNCFFMTSPSRPLGATGARGGMARARNIFDG